MKRDRVYDWCFLEGMHVAIFQAASGPFKAQLEPHVFCGLRYPFGIPPLRRGIALRAAKFAPRSSLLRLWLFVRTRLVRLSVSDHAIITDCLNNGGLKGGMCCQDGARGCGREVLSTTTGL